MIKSLLLVFILLVLWLLCSPANSTTLPADSWNPSDSWEWVIVVKPGPEPFKVFQVSEHFRWEWGDAPYHPVERIGEAEHLVWATVGERPVAAPEPMTAMLLGSGFLGMAAIRRKNRASENTGNQ